jgi:hypothetical protein
MGAQLLEPYRNTRVPHRVRCAAGHECLPRPGDVLNGNGVCRVCAGMVWDTFYVVTSGGGERLKFGISSHGGKARLADHRGAGYRTVVRVLAGLPGATAPHIERATLGALHLAGYTPIRGREYYDGSALALVLDVVDNYPVK